ncbi:MAG: 4Fe-4S dicluster domain-containing protein [Desulfobacteraceae bacterium]|jgi:polyferredoxin/formate hydrogenlyase subunit 6/NADH:ubiquinone oxidoreductase subunit I
MKIVTTRRIAQLFFFLLFLWFCVVNTLGENWWQLRGWPINWLIQLDPLIGLGVLLATHTVYAGLLWGVLTLMLTFFLGRFFCGWVCPFGALQQFVGYLGKRREKLAARISRNQPHGAQVIKYWILLFLLGAACADLLQFVFIAPYEQPIFFILLIVLAIVFVLLLAVLQAGRPGVTGAVGLAVVLALGIGLQALMPESDWLAASLQTGLLDPMALMYRSINLALLPFADSTMQLTAALPRFYQGAGLIGMLFLLPVLLCLRVPRFYCRFVCPLGALFGLLGRWTFYRIGKSEDRCSDCRMCEADCEGACAPTTAIAVGECVLCLNCLDQCRHQVMTYRTQPSASGEISGPDLSRRQVTTLLVSGLISAPLMRLGAPAGANWDPSLIRPPGALEETALLARCIKCGQCMRVCPTNVIQPAAWQAGAEGLWTPMLNFRIGSSGCQQNCVACSHVCPTAALRPLSVDERMGRGAFAQSGPLRIGTAFVDHGRCLPWAMDIPCIVCQENCPVSPKAIFTRTQFHVVRNGRYQVRSVSGQDIVLSNPIQALQRIGSGDFYVKAADGPPQNRWPILSHSEHTLRLGASTTGDQMPQRADIVEITVRLQKPYVDPRQCIGCGICEHECPVQGRRAIRVSAENESRQPDHRLVVN